MSSETRQYAEELVALLPWIAFIIAIRWFWMLAMRDNGMDRAPLDGESPSMNCSGGSHASTKGEPLRNFGGSTSYLVEPARPVFTKSNHVEGALPA